MSYSIAELQAKTDEDLIREHDEVAKHTVVGTSYYVAELERRSQERAAAVTERLSRVTVRLTWATTLLSAVAVAVAVVALFR